MKVAIFLSMMLWTLTCFGENSCWVPMGNRCPPGYRPTNDRAVIVRIPSTCRPSQCYPGFSPPGPMVPVAPPQYEPIDSPIDIADLPVPDSGTVEPEDPEQPEVPQADPCKELALIVAELTKNVNQTTINVNNLVENVNDLTVRVEGLELLLSPENMDKLKGEKGDKGDRGEQGIQGLQGLPGPVANFEQLPIYMEKVQMEKNGVDSQGKTIWKEGATTREVIPPGGGFRLRLFPPD